jgi:hypothetical protein
MSEFTNAESNMDPQFKFCWVIALRAEAKPLIDTLNMKLVENKSLFPIYANEETGHALVISGMGSIKSAAAATFLKTYLKINDYSAWINLGIAGFFKGPIGDIYQANKVVLKESGAAFFPGLRLSKQIPSAILFTVSKPENGYKEKVLYDMEAAGFCEMAPSFSCNELTYVIKIVSDTPSASSSLITKHLVRELIEKQLSKISDILAEIEILVEEEKKRLSIPNEVIEFEKRFKFTETNKYKFREIYRKWKVAFPSKRLDLSEFLNSQPKEIILRLEKEVLLGVEDWNAL